MSVAYASRDDVALATDSSFGFRDTRRIDRAVLAASRRVDRLCKRRFFPELGSRTFIVDDWPVSSWLDLAQHDLVSVTSMVDADGSVGASEYTLRPVNAAAVGEPYVEIEFDSVPSTSVTVTGLWGWPESLEAKATLAANITTTTATTFTSTLDNIGVGMAVKIDDEYMHVTGNNFVDSGDNLAATLNANSVTDVELTLTGYTVGEVLLIDTEQMRVEAVKTSTIVVERAVNGTVIASHNSGTDIYVNRSYTVTRGVLGSTAATHASGATVYQVNAPSLVRDLTVAYAVDTLLQERSGYARETGSGDSKREALTPGLRALERDVREAFGRVKVG